MGKLLRTLRSQLVAGAVVAVAALPGCAFFQKLGGQLPGGALAGAVSSSVTGGAGLLPGDALQSVTSTTSILRSGNLAGLNAQVASLGVSSSVVLGKLAAGAIASAVQRRIEERERKLQATQLFYAGACNLETPKPSSDPLEAEAEQAFNQGDYAKAEQSLQGLVQKREKGAPPEQLAQALNRLAALYFAQSQYAKAEPPAQRSLELREKALGKDHPDVAESLATLAEVAQAKGEFARAEPLYQRALKVREKALKEDHICVAQSANQLAGLYKQMAAYGRAEPLYKRALSIRQSKLGEQSLEVAQSSSDLGGLQLAMGNYAAAEPYYKQALAIRKAKLGADHPDVAETENELGNLYKQRGDYPLAETRFKQALAIRESKLPPGDPRTAESISDLAALYQGMGDLKAAEPLLRRALELRQKSLGDNHPSVAESLDQLAGLLLAQGSSQEAEQLLLRALKIRETKLGLSHPQVAESCSDLGDLYFAKSDLGRAEQYYQRALEVRQKALGAEHPAVARSLFKLAALYRARGDFARAEPLYQKSLQQREKLLGGQHPEVAEALVGLGATLVGTGRTEAALPILSRALAINDAVLRSISGSANEARVDAFLRTLRGQEEVVYSLLTEKLASDSVMALVATTALVRKGRSVDEAADTSHALYQGLGPEDLQKLASLREARTRRADLALAGAGIYPPEVYQKLLKDLQDEEEKLQAELVKNSAALRLKLQTVNPTQVLADVQKALPADGALVELVAYRQFNFRPSAQRPQVGPGPLRYAGIVLTHEGKAQSVDLGPGQTIDQTVGHLLSALTDPAAEWDEAAKALDQLVLAPLRPALGTKTRYYLSPDGQLSLVPFAVLPVGEGGGVLGDKTELSYLTSGRDLLRRGDADLHTSVALLSDPQFTLVQKGAAEAAAQSRGSGVYRGLRLGKVAPLPGTRQEAKAIEKLFKKAELNSLSGADATKSEFLKIEQPGILHAATHGLFLGETNKGGDTSRGIILEDEDAPARPAQTVTQSSPRLAFAENPLLSSMLVMAGAETASKLAPENRDPEIGSGLVTALEVASMNLWGTQLVVLSACETGRGDVSNLGQGVYGLRRAVMVAGAQTLLTSLWKVDDKATRDLMKRYYSNLLKGLGRAESMREAAQFVRKKHPHPYFWAPFITIGRSGPLTGFGKASKAKAAPASDKADKDDTDDDDK
jgi:CHAT domain-containing protein